MFFKKASGTILAIATAAMHGFIAGCGDDSESSGDGGLNDDGGVTDTDSDSSTTGDDDKLTLIAYHIGDKAAPGSNYFDPLAGASRFPMAAGNAWISADEGSVIESSKMQLKTFDLIDDKGKAFRVYEGDQFFEVSGTGSGVSGSASFNKPPVGTYTGYKLTTDKVQTKAKIKIGDVWYYTKEQTMIEGDPIGMVKSSEEPNGDTPDYRVMTAEGKEQIMPIDFVVPLEITEENGATIVMMNSTDYKTVSCYVDNADTDTDLTFYAINPGEGYFANLPAKPDKKVDIFLVAKKTGEDDLTVTLVLFFSGDTLLGGSCSRPMGDGRYALNCGALMGGSTATANGSEVSFSLKFTAGGLSQPDPEKYYVINGSYVMDGDKGTYTISGDVENGSPDEVPNYLQKGYDSLDGATGNVTSEALSF